MMLNKYNMNKQYIITAEVTTISRAVTIRNIYETLMEVITSYYLSSHSIEDTIK